MSQSPSSKKKEEDPKKQFNNILKTYLDNLYSQSDDSELEMEVRFGTRNIHHITQIDNNNVIKVLLSHGFELLKDDNYMLRIQNEYIDGNTGQKKISNVRTEISGLTNIHKYCKNNSVTDLIDKPGIKFTRKSYFQSGQVITYPVNQDDYNFRLSLQVEKDIPAKEEIPQNIIRNWGDNKKIFRYIKRYTLVHKDFPFNIDISVVKTSHKERNQYVPEYNVRAAKVFEAPETHELEIEVVNTKVGMKTTYQSYIELAQRLRTCIKYILCGLQQSNYPISYGEYNKVLDDYMRLVKEERYRDGMKIASKDFIGPSSYTLQMQNIISLDIVNESGSQIPNIRKNYSVTDKADGERKLMFINGDGKIYFITTNMKVEFTGAYTETPEFLNSVVDGEHIIYNKLGKTINLYAAFDIYFIDKKNITALAFATTTIADLGEKAMEYRLPILTTLIKKLKPKCITPKEKCSIRFDTKKFKVDSPSQSIFQGCASILQNVKDSLFEYETDGLIFTPMDTAVGQNKVGIKAPPFKITWDGSFKWKPPEFNTIDFLITINKTPMGVPIVENLFISGINMNKETQLSSYQIITLRVGFDENKHGYINPCENIINDKLPSVEDRDNPDSYKPVQFYPTNPTDFDAGITNIILKKDAFGNNKMFTESNEIIEDNTIVEFRYELDKDKFWRWTPLRVRHDKTIDFRAGLKNFGNAYHVANSNWHTIHNPITENIITTGNDIPYQVGDDDIYYNKLTSKSSTRGLRDFHNLFVKNLLVHSVSKRGDTLIDYAVGKGGDLPKWINAGLDFVLGFDISRDNIENRLDGACARYLNYHKKFRIVPKAIFLQANTSVNIKNGDAIYTEKGKQIMNAVFGEGAKDEKFLGRGIYKVYARGKEGFNISSIQFAIHYMFENILTLANFLRNISECTKVGGYFIGTSYDGETIFNKLRSKEMGEGVSIFRGDKKLWEVKKQYNGEEFNEDVSSLGYAIDVYQESINKVFREYLVNYSYLTRMLENYGFVPLTPAEYKDMGLSGSNGMFRQLFYQMTNDIKRDRRLENSFGIAPDMREDEREISFLNKYFIYKKIRNVDANKIAQDYINKEIDETNIDLLETEKAQKVVADLQAEAFAPKSEPEKKEPEPEKKEPELEPESESLVIEKPKKTKRKLKIKSQ